MEILDARGLRCPMPLLRLKQRLHTLAAGEQLQVETTDPGSVADFQAFLRQTGHTLLAFEEVDGGFRFVIGKREG